MLHLALKTDLQSSSTVKYIICWCSGYRVRLETGRLVIWWFYSQVTTLDRLSAHMSVIKLYNLVPATTQRFLIARKIAIGLALH